ncbi:MAG TPA: hypothetical protein VKG84_02055, partial [Candidatus Acidoferrales bacterium]|nr:hypothetical protein [Candidatus Acidoferrales bacterium]
HDGLTGFRRVKTDRGIDWGRFIDVDLRPHDGPLAVKKKRLQFAYRIDTSLVNPLHHLPHAIASNPSSLASRNLLRAWRLGLPSGQQVAAAMCIKPLDDEDILIGQGLKNLKPRPGSIVAINKVFAGNCPLCTYILAEAMLHQHNVQIPVAGKKVFISTPQLGPVGGRIVAEVFLGLMFGDSNSLLSLDPIWTPASGPRYALKDFVNYALGK